MSESLYYPRVLVCSADSFSHVDASGISLCHHFANWPIERLALVTANPAPPIDGKCGYYWKIDRQNGFLANMVKRFCAKFDSRLKENKFQVTPSAKNDNSALLFKQQNHSTFTKVIHSFAEQRRLKLEKNFWKWVHDFNPDLVYSTLSSFCYCELSLRIARHLSIPIVPHSYDDHYSSALRESVFQWIPRYLFRSKMRQVYRKTNLAIAYSSLMASEYEQLFHVPHEVIMNSSNNIVEQFPDDDHFQQDRPFRLVYIGGLHLNRWKVLHNIAKAILKLNNEGCSVEMIVHCTKGEFDCYAEYLDFPPCVKFGGTLTQSDIPSAIDSSDLPIHVESFDDQMRRRTRLSVSTKIPTYFSRAKPIFACGPPEVASCQYIADTSTGIVVNDDNPDVLASELKTLVNNRSLLKQLSLNSWNVAKNNHSTEFVSEKLRRTLCQSVENFKKQDMAIHTDNS